MIKMIKQKLLQSIAFLGLMALAMNLWAATDVNFAGFASFAAGKNIADKNNSSADYKYMDSVNVKDMSLLGLRLSATMDKLSFVTQAVMYGKDDFKPKFDWAYAAYDLGQGWSVVAGRTRTPLFMYSMYQDVAYTYTWIRPPYAVYGTPPFKSVDGLKFRYQTVMGDSWSSDLQMWYGSITDNLKSGDLDDDLKLRDTVGIAWDLEHSFLRLHMVYMTAKTSMDYQSSASLGGLLGGIDTLAGAVPAMAPALMDLQEDLLWQDRRGHFAGFGLGLDFDTFFINSEATYIYIEKTLAAPHNMQSYYLMFGVRPAEKWTLAATFTRDRDRESKDLMRESQQTIRPLDSGFADIVLSAIDQNQYYNSQGLTLTARWDFHTQASLKMEYMAERQQAGRGGNYKRPQAVRMGIDLVF